MLTFLFSAEVFRARIKPIKEKIPKHVLKVIEEELEKLQILEAGLEDISSTYGYLDWLTVLPWGTFRFAFCFMIMCVLINKSSQKKRNKTILIWLLQ